MGALLTDSVKSHLVSDVPVGIFLSGIDSGSVMALASRGVKSPIKSFSVCFKGKEFVEESCAEKLARKYGAEHYSVPVTEDDILSILPEALRAMDQPSIDGLNTFVASQSAAAAAMKVAFSAR